MRNSFFIFLATFLVLVATPIGCYAQLSECSRLQKGVFYLRNYGYGFQLYKIKRKGRVQIESGIHNGRKFYQKYRIDWTGQCTYTLKFIRSRTAYLDPGDLIKDVHLEVKVISSNKFEYVAEVKSFKLNEIQSTEILTFSSSP